MAWIKTEEALPSSNEVVFVVVISFTDVINYQVYTGMYYSRRKEWWLEGLGYTNRVYCWMKVPEIPKLDI